MVFGIRRYTDAACGERRGTEREKDRDKIGKPDFPFAIGIWNNREMTVSSIYLYLYLAGGLDFGTSVSHSSFSFVC